MPTYWDVRTCFTVPREEYVPAECARVGTLAALCSITLALYIAAVVRVLKGVSKHQWWLSRSFQLFLLLLGVVQSALMCLHWLGGSLVSSWILGLFVAYFSVVMMTAIAYNFLKISFNAMRRPDWVRLFLNPLFLVAAAGYTTVLCLSLAGVIQNASSCLSMSWLVMSGSSFALATLYGLAMIPISRTLSGGTMVRGGAKLRNVDGKFRQLRALIPVFFVCHLLNFAFDVYDANLIFKNAPGTCQNYLPVQSYAVLSVFQQTLCNLVPLWAVLVHFSGVSRTPSGYPPAVAASQSERLLPTNAINHKQGMHVSASPRSFGPPLTNHRLYGDGSYGGSPVSPLTRPPFDQYGTRGTPDFLDE